MHSRTVDFNAMFCLVQIYDTNRNNAFNNGKLSNKLVIIVMQYSISIAFNEIITSCKSSVYSYTITCCIQLPHKTQLMTEIE